MAHHKHNPHKKKQKSIERATYVMRVKRWGKRKGGVLENDN